MSVLERLRMLHKNAERLASDLPTEEMFLRFNEDIVYVIRDYIDEVKEAEG